MSAYFTQIALIRTGKTKNSVMANFKLCDKSEKKKPNTEHLQ